VKTAVVIGAGPNGLAAAVRLARAGVHVTVHEAAETIGGGCRTAELTLPGFHHDVCAAVFPFARDSPAFPLDDVTWVDAPVAAAHPLDDGDAVLLHRSLEDTVAGLGEDGDAYRQLVAPFVRAWPRTWTRRDVLRLRPQLARALHSMDRLTKRFATPRARAFLAGHAAHSVLPLDRSPSGGFALVLCAAAHVNGWPFARSGSQAVSDSLAALVRAHGGEIHCDSRVETLPDADVVLGDVAPSALARIAGIPGYGSHFRRAAAAYKVDWALNAPIPWRNADVARAGTVHVGGSYEEIVRSERDLAVERPFVLLAQPSLFDDTRAPAGMHTAWAYCHAPNGWDGDATEAIEAQIERFAPGFRDTIVGRHVLRPADLEAYNANNVGGDVVGGAMTLRQLVARPTLRAWKTPRKGVYLCSASTPPGGGVHGLNGFTAAGLALRALR
jgi:phytoene dehydrogenase-like protein